MTRAATVILSALVSVGAGAADETLKAGVFSPPRLAPDFSLQGSNGNELKLSSYRGKVVVLAFGFTTCPDVCPITLATLAQARKKLGTAAQNVQVVYVTVDPERDDVARMRTYLASIDPTFIGGTGAAGRLEAVRKEYGIIATRKTVGTSYLYGHSSFVYLIDGAGRMRALMPYGHSADDYVHDLRILMAKKS
ncbi:MAG: SCO family protein [Steroidobacterales bacterium]